MAQTLQENQTLKHLSLSGNSISNEGVMAIAQALRLNKILTWLDLSGNFLSDKGATAIALALQKNETMEHLFLNGSNISNEGGIAIAQALRVNRNLTRIYLENNDISDEAGIAIAQALQVNQALRHFRLSNNKIGPEGAMIMAQALRVNKTLVLFALDGNRISRDGGMAVAQALQENDTLNILDLRYNEISIEGGITIAQALQKNRALMKLYLSGNNITDEGVKAIARALCENKTLTCIELRRNHISAEGGKSIAQALQVNSSLIQLGLCDNHLSNEGGGAIFQALLVNKNLTQLDLSGNIISDEGAIKLARVLHSNNTIEQLYLGYNKISDEGGIAIAQALQENLQLYCDINTQLRGFIATILLQEDLASRRARIRPRKRLMHTIRNEPQQPQAFEQSNPQSQGGAAHTGRRTTAKIQKRVARNSRSNLDSQSGIQDSILESTGSQAPFPTQKTPHQPRKRRSHSGRGESTAKETGKEEVPMNTPGVVSNIFVIERRSGKLRPVVDLRHLNLSVKKERFKMEILQSILPLIRRHDWMTSIDLKDAFFHIPSYVPFLPNAGDGHQGYRILGRPLGRIADNRGIQGAHTKAYQYPGEAWLSGELGEIRSHSHTGDRTLGFQDQHDRYDAQAPAKEGQRHIASGPQTRQGGIGYSSTDGSIPRGSKCCMSGDHAGETIPTLANDDPDDSAKSQPRLGFTFHNTRAGDERTRLVSTGVQTMEREIISASSSHKIRYNRCFRQWLGGAIPIHDDRGPLVPGGEGVPHQLEGTQSSGIMPRSVSDPQGYDPTNPGRQHHSRSIRQQSRGDSLTPSQRDCTENLEVLPEATHPIGRGAHSRQPEYESGRSLSGDQDKSSLVHRQARVQQDRKGMGTTYSRSFRRQINETRSTDLLMATRTGSCSDRGASSTLAQREEPVCQFPVGTDTSNIAQSDNRTSRPDIGDPLLAFSPMVPVTTTIEDSGANQDSAESNSHRHPLDETSSQEQVVFDRLAHLREELRSKGLSLGAQRIALEQQEASGKHRSYLSAQRKWFTWCNENGVPPFLAPAAAIANFLALQYELSYRTRAFSKQVFEAT
ncbi:uncharacterized protein VTP21DRAFT_9759 [Calcarisporiella thermophila]|uniref:uncharacterized protein n=1 Tax=Calcarisporiella thermophila TaxID=911321 RepID=UPI003742BD96